MEEKVISCTLKQEQNIDITSPKEIILLTFSPIGRELTGIVPSPRTVVCFSTSGLTPS